jgi:hypothetical protein
MLRDSVQKSLKDLNSPWHNRNLSLQTNQVLFFLLLHKDLELKKQVVKGFPQLGIDAMNHKKAELFFLSLEDEIINPWLCNEKLNNERFLEKISSLYWSC